MQLSKTTKIIIIIIITTIIIIIINNSGFFLYPSWWNVARTFAPGHTLSVTYVPDWRSWCFFPILVNQL